jgi:hypothetical protein
LLAVTICDNQATAPKVLALTKYVIADAKLSLEL